MPAPGARVLDIGCATGQLLALLKHRGYGRVLGLDPSPTCAAIARRLYDVEVITGTIDDNGLPEETFDFLILSGVLEHIRDLRPVLRRLRGLLAAGGQMLICVPDAARFAEEEDAPFQQFSTEHVNFFSSQSLTGLMSANGFAPVLCQHNEFTDGRGYTQVGPVVDAVFRKSDGPAAARADVVTEPALTEYIRKSRAVDDGILRHDPGNPGGRQTDPGLGNGNAHLAVVGHQPLAGGGHHRLHRLESPLSPQGPERDSDHRPRRPGGQERADLDLLPGFPAGHPSADPRSPAFEQPDSFAVRHVAAGAARSIPIHATREPAMKLISIVTPCYNEEANVENTYCRVKALFESLGQYRYEHIFIDNCSRDGTVEILRRLASHDKNVKVIINSRNFGHVRSPMYAFLQTRGDAVIPVVADLQDPLDMIPVFLEKWEQGAKMVMGVKARSKESPVMFVIRRFYYKIASRLSEIELTNNFYGFGLYDRVMIEAMRQMNDPIPMGGAWSRRSVIRP